MSLKLCLHQGNVCLESRGTFHVLLNAETPISLELLERWNAYPEMLKALDTALYLASKTQWKGKYASSFTSAKDVLKAETDRLLGKASKKVRQKEAIRLGRRLA